MLPTNLKGQTWTHDKANMVLRKIKFDVASDLRQRDHDEFGIPLDGKVYEMRPMSEGQARRRGKNMADVETKEVMVINPQWAMNKHSGQDSMIGWRERWAEFCSKPRDDSGVRAAMAYTRDDPLGENSSGATSMADSVPWGEPDPFASDPGDEQPEAPKKRGPGRPRKVAETVEA